MDYIMDIFEPRILLPYKDPVLLYKNYTYQRKDMYKFSWIKMHQYLENSHISTPGSMSFSFLFLS